MAYPTRYRLYLGALAAAWVLGGFVFWWYSTQPGKSEGNYGKSLTPVQRISTYGESLRSYGRPVAWSVSQSVLQAEWNVWDQRIAGRFGIKPDAPLQDSELQSFERTPLDARTKNDLSRFLRLPQHRIHDELGTPEMSGEDEKGPSDRYRSKGLILYYDESGTVCEVLLLSPPGGKSPLGAAGIHLRDSRKVCEGILGLPVATEGDVYEWRIESVRLLLHFINDSADDSEPVFSIGLKIPKERPATAILPPETQVK